MSAYTDIKLTGLLGHPIEHSLSPVFMNYIFRRLRLNAVYKAFDVKPQQISQALRSLKILNFQGLNITIPFKQAAYEFVDALSKEAKLIGAVNCIVNKKGKLIGHNTDHLGFIKSLEDRNLRMRGASVVLLGCGGAARSALYALLQKGIKEVSLINRTQKNAEDFIEWAKETLGFKKMNYIGDRNALSQGIVNDADLLINTTPVGMFPDTNCSPLTEGLQFSSRHTVYDLIYNPWKTTLLKKAERQGALTINGFEMLIFQGLFSLIHWFPDIKDKLFTIKDQVIDYTKKQFRHTQ
jgi:shikimate dehydrogenase